MQGELFIDTLLAARNVADQFTGGANALWGALTNSLSTFGGTFVNGFIKVIVALLIFYIGKMIAGIIKKGVEKLLEVAKFNTAADKLQISDMLRRGNVDATPSSLLAKFVYYLIMLFVLIATFDFMGLTVISEKFSELINYMPRLLVAAVIFTLGFWLANFVRDFVKASSDSLGASTGSIVSTVIFYVILFMASVMALDQAGINTSFITGNVQIILGALLLGFAIAYGFASRGITEDLISGLFNKNKIEKGEKIRINDIEGEVVSSDNVSITVRTANDTVIVPNKELSKSNVHKLG